MMGTATDPRTTDESVSASSPETEANPEAEAAAFAAGFAEETDRPTEGSSSEPSSAEPPRPAAQSAAPQADQAPDSSMPAGGLTPEEIERLRKTAETVSQLKATIERQFGTAFGKMGSIEQTIRAIQAQTPAGQPITFSEDDFEELKNEYPELTSVLVKGLNRRAERLKGTAPPSPPAPAPESAPAAAPGPTPEQLVEQAADAAERRLVARQLTARRKDWREVVGDPDSQTPFRQWLAQQPPDYQFRILDSMDPDEIIGAIDAFEQQTKKTKPAAPPASNRANRFKDAVPPRGTGAPPPAVTPSEEEAFLEGFRS